MLNPINIQEYPNKPLHIKVGQNKNGIIMEFIGYFRLTNRPRICNLCKYVDDKHDCVSMHNGKQCRDIMRPNQYYKPEPNDI